MFRETILTLAASAALGMAALAPTIASADGMDDRKDYGSYDRRDYDRKDYDRKNYDRKDYGYDRKDYGYDRKDDYGYGKGYHDSGKPHFYGYKVVYKPWYVHKPWFAYGPRYFHHDYKFGHGYKFGGWKYGKFNSRYW